MSSTDQQLEELSQRLADVRMTIADAARRSGRPPDAVRLVAVTKTHPPAVLQAAVRAGLTDIGENYLQEAEAKFRALGWPETGAGTAPVRRHAIGHLQGNKVRTALRWFDVIQTVDSLPLARRLDLLATEMALPSVPVLLQVNTSGEPQKNGFAPEHLEGLCAELAKLSGIRIDGLMTIGRFDADPEVSRRDFIALRTLRDRLRAVSPAELRFDELSMGMSHDFAIAIEEGATIVRLGSRLFGARLPHDSTAH